MTQPVRPRSGRVTARSAARLAWSLCGGSVARICGRLVLQGRAAPAPQSGRVAAAGRRGVRDRQPPRRELRPLCADHRTRIAARRPLRRLAGLDLRPRRGDPGDPPAAVLPDRSALSPRWRPVVWSGIGFLVFAVAGNALLPGPQPPLPGLAPAPNPVVYLPHARPPVR